MAAPKKDAHPLRIAQVIVVFNDGSTLLLNKNREQAAMSDLFGISTGPMTQLENELIAEKRRRNPTSPTL